MGLLSATCSFTRFRIEDAIPKELWLEIPDRLKQFAFQDIDETAEERAFGWTCFEDMLDMHWHTAHPEKGAYLVFSLRLDTRRVPAGVIKKHFALALKKEKQDNAAQNKQFISRERKKELKEQVVLRLRRHFLPVPAEFNVVWAKDSNVVWFASTQGKMVEMFTEYFTRTFDLHLEQMTPYGLAMQVLDENQLAQLDKLEPTHFAAE